MNNIAITIDNFQQILLEDSKTKPVVIVFWAEQVPESTELLNQVSQKLNANNEAVLFASVDCQSQQQIAMQFGIQGLPTLIVVKDGQLVDGVAGPQTDEALTTLLEKYLPKPEDEFLAQAQQAINNDDGNGAYSAAMQAFKANNNRIDVKFALIEASIMVGKLNEAETLLGEIKLVDQDADYQALKAKLELAQEASDSPEIKALEQAHQQNPDDVDVIHKLAAQYNQANRAEDALALLFKQVKSHLVDAESKRLLLDVIKALPEGDALAGKYRRKLYTLLY